MKPTDKNVRMDAAGKLKLTERDVENIAIQMSAALAGNTAGLFVQQGQDHRNVMGCEAPQDVLFRPDFADVQPVGVQALNLAQRSVADQFLQLHYGRMVSQNMPDH